MIAINPLEECRNVMELCREFNASVKVAEGLPTTEKDKYVLGSSGALWGLVAELLEFKNNRHGAEQTAAPIVERGRVASAFVGPDTGLSLPPRKWGETRTAVCAAVRAMAQWNDAGDGHIYVSLPREPLL